MKRILRQSPSSIPVMKSTRLSPNRTTQRFLKLSLCAGFLAAALNATAADAPTVVPVDHFAAPEGLEVTLWAASPLLHNPTNIDIDKDGRIWVAEGVNYRGRYGRRAEGDRIAVLEDTDGDGVFDDKKTFTDKLTFTSGLACGFGGVFVGSPPHLTFIPDTDGDDKPDGPPQALLDGWGINDRHETLNSFIWGPDGWLYGCHGVFTESRVGKPGDDDSDRQFIDGGIFLLFCFLFLYISLVCFSIYPLYFISVDALLKKISSSLLSSIRLFSSTSGLANIKDMLLFSSSETVCCSLFIKDDIFVLSNLVLTNSAYCFSLFTKVVFLSSGIIPSLKALLKSLCSALFCESKSLCSALLVNIL